DDPALPQPSLRRRPPPPVPTLFPYTTLFRSRRHPPTWVSRGYWRISMRHPWSSVRCRCSRLSLWSAARSTTFFTNSFGMKWRARSEEHTSELQSRGHLVCRLLLEKKKRTPTD